jgi:hypothetical protein
MVAILTFLWTKQETLQWHRRRSPYYQLNECVLLIRKEPPPYMYMGESFAIDVIIMRNDVGSTQTTVQLPLL